MCFLSRAQWGMRHSLTSALHPCGLCRAGKHVFAPKILVWLLGVFLVSNAAVSVDKAQGDRDIVLG